MNPSLPSSDCSAVRRSVSLILSDCRPVNLNGMDSRQQVTARVCARSGVSDRSAIRRAPASGVGVSSISLSETQQWSRPVTLISSEIRLSPCIDFRLGPFRRPIQRIWRRFQTSMTPRSSRLPPRVCTGGMTFSDCDGVVCRNGFCAGVGHHLQGHVYVWAR